jgi:hypothetical protein
MWRLNMQSLSWSERAELITFPSDMNLSEGNARRLRIDLAALAELVFGRPPPFADRVQRELLREAAARVMELELSIKRLDADSWVFFSGALADAAEKSSQTKRHKRQWPTTVPDDVENTKNGIVSRLEEIGGLFRGAANLADKMADSYEQSQPNADMESDGPRRPRGPMRDVRLGNFVAGLDQLYPQYTGRNPRLTLPSDTTRGSTYYCFAIECYAKLLPDGETQRPTTFEDVLRQFNKVASTTSENEN